MDYTPHKSKNELPDRCEMTSTNVLDRGWSWVVALACCFANCTLYGAGSRLSGLLLVALVEEFGVSRAAASLPFSTGSAVRNLTGPFVGFLGQRFGIRPVVSAGCILATVGVGLCFFVSDVFWATVCWGGIFGTGLGLATSLLPLVINQSFNKLRSTASGISYSGSYIGSFIFPPIAALLLDTYGLSGTFLVLSGVILNSLVAATLFWPLKTAPTFPSGIIKQLPKIQIISLRSLEAADFKNISVEEAIQNVKLFSSLDYKALRPELILENTGSLNSYLNSKDICSENIVSDDVPYQYNNANISSDIDSYIKREQTPFNNNLESNLILQTDCTDSNVGITLNGFLNKEDVKGNTTPNSCIIQREICNFNNSDSWVTASDKLAFSNNYYIAEDDTDFHMNASDRHCSFRSTRCNNLKNIGHNSSLGISRNERDAMNNGNENVYSKSDNVDPHNCDIDKKQPSGIIVVVQNDPSKSDIFQKNSAPENDTTITLRKQFASKIDSNAQENSKLCNNELQNSVLYTNNHHLEEYSPLNDNPISLEYPFYSVGTELITKRTGENNYLHHEKISHLNIYLPSNGNKVTPMNDQFGTERNADSDRKQNKNVTRFSDFFSRTKMKSKTLRSQNINMNSLHLKAIPRLSINNSNVIYLRENSKIELEKAKLVAFRFLPISYEESILSNFLDSRIFKIYNDKQSGDSCVNTEAFSESITRIPNEKTIGETRGEVSEGNSFVNHLHLNPLEESEHDTLKETGIVTPELIKNLNETNICNCIYVKPKVECRNCILDKKMWKTAKIKTDYTDNESKFVSITEKNLNNIEDDPSKTEKSMYLDIHNCFCDWIAMFSDVMFVIISVTMSLYSFVVVCVITIIEDYAKDLNTPQHLIHYILMALSAADLFGTLALGWITDRGFMTRSHFIVVCFLGMGVSVLGMAFCTHFHYLLSLVTMYGVFESGVVITFPLLTAQFIAGEKQPQAIASSNLLSAPVVLLVPLVIGYFRDHLGCYDGLFYLLSVTLFVCCGFWIGSPLLLRRREARTLVIQDSS